MSKESLDFLFIGWCNEGTSDKIWGSVRMTNTGSLYTFWFAREGKAIKFKRHDSRWEVDELIRSKRKKYHSIDLPKAEQVVDNFIERLETRFLEEKFSGTIRNDDVVNKTFL